MVQTQAQQFAFWAESDAGESLEEAGSWNFRGSQEGHLLSRPEPHRCQGARGYYWWGQIGSVFRKEGNGVQQAVLQCRVFVFIKHWLLVTHVSRSLWHTVAQ